MLKLINHIIKEDKTRHGGSLEATQFTRNCAHQVVSIKIACILNNSELSRISDWEGLSLSQSKTVLCLVDPQISRTISDVRASLFLPETLLQRDALATHLSLGKCSPHLYAKCVAAMRDNWWYYSCHFIFDSKFQVVVETIPKSDNGKFNHQYNLLVKKRRGNWGYKINGEKNRSKEIKEKWKLYRAILGKYRYISVQLGVRSRSASCCPAFLKGTLPYSRGTGRDYCWATSGRSLYRLFTTGLLWARLPCFIGIGNKSSWGNLRKEHTGDRVR